MNKTKKTPPQALFLGIVLLLFLVFQILPFAYGYAIRAEDTHFSGFIMRWNDNNTYLAKMKQGAQGAWLFSFDYAQNPQDQAFIYPLYLALGHLANFLSIDFLPTFHIARILASLLMFASLYRYLHQSFPHKPTSTKAILLFAILAGTGLSWSSMYFIDSFTSLLEAFPNNAAFANVHFPLTLAALFTLFTPHPPGSRKWFHYLADVLLSALCALVSSFAVVVLIVVFAGMLLIRWSQKQPLKQTFWRWILIGNGGGWIILYQFWVMQTKPEFILWAQQNIIGKISLPNLLLSFFPYSLFFIIAVITFLKKPAAIPPHKHSFYAWSIAIPLFLLIPSPISTRFLIGSFVPLVLISFDLLFSHQFKKEALILNLSTLISTVLIIFETGLLLLIVQNQRSLTYASTFIPQDVFATYQYIDTHLPPNSFILTEHYNGNYIPRFTNSVPTLGHWCETPHAYQRDQLVKNYFTGQATLADLQTLGVEYIFYGPGEQALGHNFDSSSLIPVFQQGTVTLYQIPNP